MVRITSAMEEGLDFIIPTLHFYPATANSYSKGSSSVGAITH